MSDLRVIIFNVEHGFCAFVKSPTGHTLLIDCGKASKFSPIKYVLDYELDDTIEYVNKYNCRYKLTEFILSHPHGDHVEDVERLINSFKPGIIFRQEDYNWEAVKNDNTEEGAKNVGKYKEWQETYTVPVDGPNWGMKLYYSKYLTPLQAHAVDKAKFVNNSSIPVMIEFQGSKFKEKFFFSGDLEEAAWKVLLEDEAFKNALKGTDFFITAHHGHSTGYCKEIYNVMGKPIVNIVSARRRDESIEGAYSKPENAIGAKFNGEIRYMLSTRKDGTIFIEVDSEGKYSIWGEKLEDNIKPYNSLLSMGLLGLNRKPTILTGAYREHFGRKI